MKRVLFALILSLALPALASAAPVTPLTAGDAATLIQPPAHGERIIALWSLDCAYCEANLSALAKLQKAHPQAVELVLVATDGPARHDAVVKRLERMHMTGYRNHLYAEAAPERLNYLLDSHWGGELPRTLVIRSDGTRTGVSGELTPTQLQRVAP